ncbi:hypothetical protein E2C01_102003 [Portunus trituberculatus]|uniref:Uncharacterized protein n=1 Tax=Portunus trituberculatus TaxID=210409 RepID=A0A5B7KLQ8_PORTR|nr:hypothetical protein [Portunus trituberculatus]
MLRPARNILHYHPLLRLLPRSPPSREASLLSRSWIHATPFDSSGSVKASSAFWKVKSRSRPQPVNATLLGLPWDRLSPSTSPLRHRISITSPRPVFPRCLHI